MRILPTIRVASAVITVAFFFATPVSAGYELVCDGRSPSSSNTPITVDCSNRRAVVETLKKAWTTLRQQGIGGNMEIMCWNPYQQVKKLHPSIPLNDGIAETFFMQCNTALEYAE